MIDVAIMQDLYNSNTEFKEYVDRYCQNYMEGRNITVAEALEHAVIKIIAQQCRD